LRQAFRATAVPTALPARSADLKWIPPSRLEKPAWSAASENVFQCSVVSVDGVIPGSIFEAPACSVTEAPKRSDPVNKRKISAPAALNELCPETNSGNGGVGKVLAW